MFTNQSCNPLFLYRKIAANMRIKEDPTRRSKGNVCQKLIVMGGSVIYFIPVIKNI
jgi:hypothetical protein